MPKDKVQNASGLYNLTRNLGGAIGLAFINSLIISKSKIFTQSMKDNMAFTSPLVQEQLGFFTGMLQGKVENPKLAAYALLDNTINQQAFIIAINNIFIIIALMFCLSTLLLPFTSTVNNEGSDLGGH